MLCRRTKYRKSSRAFASVRTLLFHSAFGMLTHVNHKLDLLHRNFLCVQQTSKTNTTSDSGSIWMLYPKTSALSLHMTEFSNSKPYPPLSHALSLFTSTTSTNQQSTASEHQTELPVLIGTTPARCGHGWINRRGWLRLLLRKTFQSLSSTPSNGRSARRLCTRTSTSRLFSGGSRSKTCIQLELGVFDGRLTTNAFSAETFSQ